MKPASACDARNALGLIIDTARAKPVLVKNQARSVVTSIAVENYETMSFGLVAQGKATERGADAAKK